MTRETSLRDPEMSYAQAVSSSSSGDRIQVKTMTSKSSKGGGIKLVGAKHPRSPRSPTCGRCFRTSHLTAECRHQVVCLRCSGVGHLAARCLVETHHNPRRKRIHIRSKRMALPERQEDSKEMVVPSIVSVPKLQSVAETSLPGRKS